MGVNFEDYKGANSQGNGYQPSKGIADLLRDTQRLEDESRARVASWETTPEIDYNAMRAGRMGDTPEWARQNPTAEGMGYEWADDKTLKSFGWDDGYINHLKNTKEFDPREIEYLRNMGALRAPYAEYQAEQERRRRESEAMSYSYDGYQGVPEQYGNYDGYNTFDDPSARSSYRVPSDGRYSLESPDYNNRSDDKTRLDRRWELHQRGMDRNKTPLLKRKIFS